jgi:hypothetical protein
MVIENTSGQKPGFITVFGCDPGTIERQEKEGQQQLINSSQLPKRGIENVCKEITIKGDSKDDPLFVDVKLPAEWKIIETDSSFWSKLIDEKGITKANIFYKATFYDRRAFIQFIQ